MYDFVSPEKDLGALRWLKANNPLYASVDINENWLEESQANDSDLFAGMVEQPENDKRSPKSSDIDQE